MNDSFCGRLPNSIMRWNNLTFRYRRSICRNSGRCQVHSRIVQIKHKLYKFTNAGVGICGVCVFRYLYINIYTHMYLHLCSLFFIVCFFGFLFAWCVLIQNNKKLTKNKKDPVTEHFGTSSTSSLLKPWQVCGLMGFTPTGTSQWLTGRQRGCIDEPSLLWNNIGTRLKQLLHDD